MLCYLLTYLLKNVSVEDPVKPASTSILVENAPVEDPVEDPVEPESTSISVENAPVEDPVEDPVEPESTSILVENAPVEDPVEDPVEPESTSISVEDAPVENPVEDPVKSASTSIKQAGSPPVSQRVSLLAIRPYQWIYTRTHKSVRQQLQTQFQGNDVQLKWRVFWRLRHTKMNGFRKILWIGWKRRNQRDWRNQKKRKKVCKTSSFLEKKKHIKITKKAVKFGDVEKLK